MNLKAKDDNSINLQLNMEHSIKNSDKILKNCAADENMKFINAKPLEIHIRIILPVLYLIFFKVFSKS